VEPFFAFVTSIYVNKINITVHSDTSTSYTAKSHNQMNSKITYETKNFFDSNLWQLLHLTDFIVPNMLLSEVEVFWKSSMS